MARALVEEGLVGAVWALVWPDSSWSGAAGRRNAAHDVPLAPSDRVQVGSVTKTLVATGILRLVTEGRVQLEQPVSELLPAIRFDNPWGATDPVRLRHLLDHTAGLNDARLWQVFSLKPTPDSPLAEAIGSRPLRVRTRAGSRMSYSNTGYTLLGMVIESVTGERYETWLDRNLLAPLGMVHSTFAFVSQETDSTLAMGHFEDGVTQAAVPFYQRPPGQFTTTAADMARFSRFLLGDGRIGDTTFIEESLLRSMGSPVGTEAREAGLEAGYGLGLSLWDRYGVVGRCHSGSTVGFRAMLCLFPREGKAFFIALNADSETADYGRFDSLLVRALDVTPFPAIETTDAPDLSPWTGRYVRAPGRFESFAYLDRVLDFATVTNGKTRLDFKRFQGTIRTLVPVGKELLRANDRSTASHAVYTSESGRRIISDGFQTWERRSLLELGAYWLSLAMGALGAAYLLGTGLVRLVRRSLRPADPAFAPILAVLGLFLPLPFFLRQSFLALGDLTVASGLLALATLALPVGMVIGLRQFIRSRPRRKIIDAVAMAAVLQLVLVLAIWRLVPLVLWIM